MSSIEFPEGTLWSLLEHYGWELPAPRYGWQTVKCAAHKDSHASCRVNNQIGAVKCHACEFRGDLVSIVQFYEGKGVTFVDAIGIIEKVTGASGDGVREQSRFRSQVPSGARNKRRDGSFVSPRLRGKSASR